MIDRPHARDIVAAVAAALRSGRASRFELLVAANALSIAERELRSRGTCEARWQRALETMLGESGDLQALTASLADRLRGSRGEPDAATAAHLWDVTMAKLAIDQPGYPSYLAESEGDSDAR